jgi:hypothetical protein
MQVVILGKHTHMYMSTNQSCVTTDILLAHSTAEYLWNEINTSGGMRNIRHLWVDCQENVGASTSHNPMGLHGLFFLIGIVGGGVQLGPLGTAATNRPIVPASGDYDDGEIGGIIGRGNRSTSSTTNFTCCPDANPGRRGGKPATNRLSYGTAFPRPVTEIALPDISSYSAFSELEKFSSKGNSSVQCR